MLKLHELAIEEAIRRENEIESPQVAFGTIFTDIPKI